MNDTPDMPPISPAPAIEPTLVDNPNPTPETPPTPEPSKAEDFQPLTVEALKVPEGMTLADDTAQAFLGLANEMKMPAEQAQKFLDMHAAELSKVAKAPLETWQATNQQWREAVQKDPEIGGERLNTEVLPAISRMLDGLPDKGAAFRMAMTITGAGNNPDIIKGLFAFAGARTEGTPVSGGAPSGKSVPRSAAEAMFPNLAKG